MFNKKYFDSQKKIAELQERNTFAAQELERVQGELLKAAVLVSIDRAGRVIKFTFMRQGKFHTIETMGMMSDDTAQWKQDLLA